MYTESSDTSLRQRAERRAEAKLKFYASIAGFIALNAFLFALNWWTEGRISWAFWPLLGTSFGLVNQGIRVWSRSDTVYQRMVEREMDAISRKEK